MDHITIFGQLISFKNSKRIVFPKTRDGRRVPRIIQSKAADRYEKNAVPQLDAFLHIWKRLIRGKRFPFFIEFSIYRESIAAFDYLNIVQQVLDLMEKAGYFPDDTADCVLPIFQPYQVDPNNPRVEIRVL